MSSFGQSALPSISVFTCIPKRLTCVYGLCFHEWVSERVSSPCVPVSFCAPCTHTPHSLPLHPLLKTTMKLLNHQHHLPPVKLGSRWGVLSVIEGHGQWNCLTQKSHPSPWPAEHHPKPRSTPSHQQSWWKTCDCGHEVCLLQKELWMQTWTICESLWPP